MFKQVLRNGHLTVPAAKERCGDLCAAGRLGLVKKEGSQPRLIGDSSICLGSPLSWHKLQLSSSSKWIGWSFHLDGLPRTFLPQTNKRWRWLLLHLFAGQAPGFVAQIFAG